MTEETNLLCSVQQANTMLCDLLGWGWAKKRKTIKAGKGETGDVGVFMYATVSQSVQSEKWQRHLVGNWGGHGGRSGICLFVECRKRIGPK